MRFQVPQFIEVEDKIIGQLTIKQFLYIAGSLGLSFLIYRLIGSFILASIFIIPLIGFGLALAFYKVNNKPFIFVVESAFKYFFAEKLYLWHKKDRPIAQKEEDAVVTDMIRLAVPKLSDSKLKDLTWSLDIKQAESPVTMQGGKRNM